MTIKELFFNFQSDHEEFVKAEPEFISVTDNLISKDSSVNNENTLQIEATDKIKNEYDVFEFPFKEETCEEERDSVIPKKEDIV